jgi:capsular polysaccharide biosynthesis protein
VEYSSLYEQYVNPLELSDALYRDLSAYAKPTQREVTIDYYFVDVPNGRVFFPNPGCVSVVTERGELVGDVSFNYAAGQIIRPEQNSVFKLRHFPEPIRLQGNAFSMLTGGGGAGNYAHWLIDSLSRLHLLRKSGRFDEVDHFLVPEIKYDFQQDSIAYLGVDPSKLVPVRVGEHYIADCIMASTAPRAESIIIPKWIVEFYRESLLSLPDIQDTGISNLYVSRSDSGIRNVTNETELVAMLEQYGFRSVALSQFSFIEKVNLFAHADNLVSAHGAGLVNVMFSPRKSNLLELYPDQYVLTTYADLAASVGLNYAYQLCPCSEPAVDAMKGQEVHLTVSIPEVEAAVQKMTSAGKVNL